MDLFYWSAMCCCRFILWWQAEAGFMNRWVMMEQLIGRLLEENCPYLPSGGSVDQHLKWIKGQCKVLSSACLNNASRILWNAYFTECGFNWIRILLNSDFINVPAPWNFGTDPDADLDPPYLSLRGPEAPDPAFFISDQSSSCQLLFFLQLLCLFFFEGTFSSFVKDKKSLRSHKPAEIEVFLYFFASWWKVPESLQIYYKSGCGSRRPKI